MPASSISVTCSQIVGDVGEFNFLTVKLIVVSGIDPLTLSRLFVIRGQLYEDGVIVWV